MRKFTQKHLQSMQEQADSAIKHMVAVGMGDEKTLRERFEKGIDAARDFLEPSGNVDLARAGLLFIESYKDLPLLSWPRRLLDEIVAFEQSMLHFRSHHARMVERMIGRRIGTGGSSGVDYLDETVKYRVFEDLWKVRTILIRADALPELSKPEYYDFADQT
jgi:tryptophan 2,3-dioxygenase